MRWAWIFAAFLASVAAAGTIDPRASDQKHLDYGAKFDCVAGISCIERPSGRKASASCVIISPRHIVTAAHVVEDADGWVVQAVTGDNKLAEVIIHPEFKSGGRHDIAVGVAERDFGLDFYPDLYGDENEQGRVAAICGYGITGTFLTGSVISDGKKRAGSNIVDFVDNQGLLVCSVGSGVKTELEFLIAPGDSGGGLFIDGKLAGINSVVMCGKGKIPSSRLGEESGHTRVSSHRGWILEHTK